MSGVPAEIRTEYLSNTNIDQRVRCSVNHLLFLSYPLRWCTETDLDLYFERDVADCKLKLLAIRSGPSSER
jgi:hypothetical protein